MGNRPQELDSVEGFPAAPDEDANQLRVVPSAGDVPRPVQAEFNRLKERIAERREQTEPSMIIKEE